MRDKILEENIDGHCKERSGGEGITSTRLSRRDFVKATGAGALYLALPNLAKISDLIQSGNLNFSDRIVQKIRIPTKIPTEIPTEYVEIEVNTSREELSGLINRLITDEEFRIQFNKNPNKIFQDIGIFLDSATIKKLESSPITTMVRDISPQPAAFSAAIVIIGVIVGVIALQKPAE